LVGVFGAAFLLTNNGPVLPDKLLLAHNETVRLLLGIR
jgi:hypothetical protein